MLNYFFHINPLWDVLIVAAIIALIVAYFKWPDQTKEIFKFLTKWVLAPLVVVLVTASAIYSTIHLNLYYSASGGIYGTISQFFGQNNQVNVEVDEKTFTFKDVVLTQVEGDTYSAKFVSNQVIKLEAGQEYAVFINDTPCTYTKSNPNYFKSIYSYNFYNKDDEIVMSDTLELYFQLNNNGIVIEVQTKGGTSAVRYWNDYFNRNNFNVRVAKTNASQGGDISIGDGDVSNFFKTITYYLDGEVYTTQTQVINCQIHLDEPTMQQGYIFDGWYDINGAKITEVFTIKDNVELCGYSRELLNFQVVGNIDSGVITNYSGPSTSSLCIPSAYSVVNGQAVKGDDILVTRIESPLLLSNLAQVEEVIIPSTITSVGSNTFELFINLQRIFVESKTIYTLISQNQNPGMLLNNVLIEIYIDASVDDGSNSYLNTNYNKTSIIKNEKAFNQYVLKSDADVSVIFYIEINDGLMEKETRVYKLGDEIGILPETWEYLTRVNENDEVYMRASFKGWYDNNNNTITEDSIVVPNLVIYAKYNEWVNCYTVKFYNESELYDTQLVDENEHPTVPAIPVREFYDFNCWTKDGKTPANIATEVITENTTYFAWWIENTSQYQSTFVLTWTDYVSGQEKSQTLTTETRRGEVVQAPFTSLTSISESLEIYEIESYQVDNVDIDLSTYLVYGDTTFAINLRQKTLSELSWYVIKKVSTAGHSALFFSVGDEKNITLTNADVLTLVILDFTHDVVEGYRSSITFGLKNLMRMPKYMNSTVTNAGGYASTYMAQWLETDVYAILPSDLKEVITYADKTCSYRLDNGTTQTQVIRCKLWLFSETEITGKTTVGQIAEGAQYEYYKTHDYTKVMDNGTGSNFEYWLRTVYPSNAGNFVLVGKGNFTTTTDANKPYGVCFGFCV